MEIKATNEFITIYRKIIADIPPKLEILIVDELKRKNEELQKKWKEKVKEALSDPIPKGMIHRKRFPRNRLFPYKVSGELVNSLRTHLIYSRNGHRHKYKNIFEFASKHAYLTNAGWGGQPPQISSDAGWRNWTFDVLIGDSRATIKSAKSLIMALFKGDNLYRLVREAKGML